jgi:hypothetical protein
MRIESVALGTFVILSILASATVNFSEVEERSSIQPRNVAFSIWWVIFSLLIASAIQFYHSPSSSEAAWFVTASLAETVVWAFSVERYPRLALASILLSTATAYPAVLLESRLLPSAAYGLYAGWLTVASVLSTLSNFSGLDTTRALLPVSLFVGGVAVASKNVWFAVPLVWALLLQKSIDYNVAASLVPSLASITVALL